MSICKYGHDTSITGRTKSNNCKVCMKKYLKEWNQRWPEYAREYSKGYTKNLRPYYREYDWKRKKIVNPDGSQFLTPDKDKLFEQQSGRCAICERHDGTLKHTLAADHDHSSGVIRGLLCDNCNKLLGHAFDSTIVLERAIEYLQKNVFKGIKL